MKKLFIILVSCLCLATSSLEKSKAVQPENLKPSQVYIDAIEKFDDNNTFYVDLKFSTAYNPDERQALILTGEEEIFNDGNVTRTLIPERVRSLFQLQGLSTITIYSKDNVKLTTGKYSHIEYVQDLIEDKFVAVFKVENPNIKDFAFCVGDQTKDLARFTYTEYTDDPLKTSLVKYLKKSEDQLWQAIHYKINQSVYSAISIDTSAYIIETVAKNHKALYTSKYPEAIRSLTFISKTVNGRPIILAQCGEPETDMTWTALLTFTGTSYQYAKDNLVKE